MSAGGRRRGNVVWKYSYGTNHTSYSRWSVVTAAARSSFVSTTRKSRVLKGAIEKAWDSSWARCKDGPSRPEARARGGAGGPTIPGETARRAIACARR